jgi:DNA repair protein RadC
MEEMRYLKKEYFKTVQLNIKNQVLTVEDISVGSLNASIVHPREVFQGPIRRSSAAIILVHNHPSGDPVPSKEDIDVTKRLCEAGKLLGIDVLDHIIIGDGVFTSFKEKGMI